MQTLTRAEPCSCETGQWGGQCAFVTKCRRNAAVEAEAEAWARKVAALEAENATLSGRYRLLRMVYMSSADCADDEDLFLNLGDSASFADFDRAVDEARGETGAVADDTRSADLADMAVLIRRLARRLGRADTLRLAAMRYLAKIGMAGEPLREKP